MNKKIVAAELSLKDVSPELLSRFSFDEIKIKAYLTEIHNTVDEVVILAIKERFVIYAVYENVSPLAKFLESAEREGCSVRYFHDTKESVHHAFAVASGMYSDIKGEHQSLDKFKQAYQFALECNTVGFMLDNLMIDAEKVGRRVRIETGIDLFCTSIVDAGFSVLYNHFQHFKDVAFLVVGTGRIAQLALEILHWHRAQSVFLLGRNKKQTAALAKKYRTKVVDAKHLSTYLLLADVIIGTEREEIQNCKIERTSNERLDLDTDKKRILLDFGIPPVFDEKFRNFNGLLPYTLDDLKAVYPSPIEDFGGIYEAWKIITTETESFCTMVRLSDGTDLLASRWKRFLNFNEKELDWIFVGKSLDQKMASSEKLSHRPTSTPIEIINEVYGIYNITPNLFLN